MITGERKDDLQRTPGRSEFMIICRLSEYLCRKQRYSLKNLLRLVEKNIIMDVLHRANGNQRDAGRILGLKSTTLSAKMKRYGIRVVRRIGVHSLLDDPSADEYASDIAFPPTSFDPNRLGRDLADRGGIPPD